MATEMRIVILAVFIIFGGKCRKFSVKLPNIRLHKNPFKASCVATRAETDGRTDMAKIAG
jgi:hypothetical protein